MTYRGRVHKGTIVLDEAAVLADGTEVDVIVRVDIDHTDRQTPPRSVRERLAPFIGMANDLPGDAAENHDYYLYGTPKK